MFQKVILRARWLDWMCLIGFRDFISSVLKYLLKSLELLRMFNQRSLGLFFTTISSKYTSNPHCDGTAGRTDSERVCAREKHTFV